MAKNPKNWLGKSAGKPKPIPPGRKHGALRHGATPKSLDPREMFLQAAFFDHACLLLSAVANANLQRRPRPPRDPIPPDYINPKPGDGYSLSQVGDKSELPPTFIPLVVNSILTVELYLKTIIVLTGRTFPEKHNLTTLWAALDSNWQAALEKIYNHDRQNDPGYFAAKNKAEYDLSVLLQKQDMAFVQWRYHYEFHPPSGATLQPLRIAARQEILRFKPEWQPLWQKIDVLPTLLYR